jgi:hypothetical protein
MRSNKTGLDIVAVGKNALQGNVSGEKNTATDNDALLISYGNANTAFGYKALENNYDGNDNVAIGSGAIQFGINGSNSK